MNAATGTCVFMSADVQLAANPATDPVLDFAKRTNILPPVAVMGGGIKLPVPVYNKVLPVGIFGPLLNMYR